MRKISDLHFQGLELRVAAVDRDCGRCPRVHYQVGALRLLRAVNQSPLLLRDLRRQNHSYVVAGAAGLCFLISQM